MNGRTPRPGTGVVALASPQDPECPVADASAKQRVVEAVQQLPENATVEDAMERLYFLAKVDRGLEDAQAGRSVSHEEIRRRFIK